MNPEKSSSENQTHGMEIKGEKSSPHGATTFEAEVDSSLNKLLNPPTLGANEKDQDLYRILYKEQSGSGQAAMADGKTQWSPSSCCTAYNKDGKHSQTCESLDTSCFGSSVHYGGQDYNGGSGTMQTTKSSNEYKADKKDTVYDFHGEWWKGSFYY